MSDVHDSVSAQSAGALLRARRERAGYSLDDLADRIELTGVDRPSTAKLSRIETGIQPVPTNLLEPLVMVARIPARMLRPDLYKLMRLVPPRRRRRDRKAA